MQRFAVTWTDIFRHTVVDTWVISHVNSNVPGSCNCSSDLSSKAPWVKKWRSKCKTKEAENTVALSVVLQSSTYCSEEPHINLCFEQSCTELKLPLLTKTPAGSCSACMAVISEKWCLWQMGWSCALWSTRCWGAASRCCSIIVPTRAVHGTGSSCVELLCFSLVYAVMVCVIDTEVLIHVKCHCKTLNCIILDFL